MRFKPIPKDKFVEFSTLYNLTKDPSQKLTVEEIIKEGARLTCIHFADVCGTNEVLSATEYADRCFDKYDFYCHSQLSCFLLRFGEDSYVCRNIKNGWLQVIIKPIEYFRCAGLLEQTSNFNRYYNKDNFEEVLMWHDLNLEYIEAEYNSTGCVYVFEN